MTLRAGGWVVGGKGFLLGLGLGGLGRGQVGSDQVKAGEMAQGQVGDGRFFAQETAPDAPRPQSLRLEFGNALAQFLQVGDFVQDGLGAFGAHGAAARQEDLDREGGQGFQRGKDAVDVVIAPQGAILPPDKGVAGKQPPLVGLEQADVVGGCGPGWG